MISQWPWPYLINDQGLLVLCSRLLHHRGDSLDLLYCLTDQPLFLYGGCGVGLWCRPLLPLVLLWGDGGWGLTGFFDWVAIGILTEGPSWPTLVVVYTGFRQRQRLWPVFLLAVTALCQWALVFLGWSSTFPAPVIPGWAPEPSWVGVRVSSLKLGGGFSHPWQVFQRSLGGGVSHPSFRWSLNSLPAFIII